MTDNNFCRLFYFMCTYHKIYIKNIAISNTGYISLPCMITMPTPITSEQLVLNYTVIY